jgi:hypothetical protein
MIERPRFEDVQVGDRVGIYESWAYGHRRSYSIGTVTRKTKAQCVVTVGEKAYRLNKHMVSPGHDYGTHHSAVAVGEAEERIAAQEQERAEARAMLAAYLRDLADRVEHGETPRRDDVEVMINNYVRTIR